MRYVADCGGLSEIEISVPQTTSSSLTRQTISDTAYDIISYTQSADRSTCVMRLWR